MSGKQLPNTKTFRAEVQNKSPRPDWEVFVLCGLTASSIYQTSCNYYKIWWFQYSCSVLDWLAVTSIICNVLSPGNKKTWHDSWKTIMKCNYVRFITLNSCFINSDALQGNQITVKTYDICPLLQSPAQHTSQVSLCLTDVSSGLDCRVCEGTGIQRGAKFRSLTWLRTQGSRAEGPLEYQQTPQSSSRWHQSCLSEISPSNMDTADSCLRHASPVLLYDVKDVCDPEDAQRCVWELLRDFLMMNGKTLPHPKYHRCHVLGSCTLICDQSHTTCPYKEWSLIKMTLHGWNQDVLGNYSLE